MVNMDEALDNFIAAIKDSDVYAEYRKALEDLKADPDLKRRVDDFRQRNYNFQQSDDINLEEYDRFRTEIMEFRAADQRVDVFLESELALCRMIQKIDFKITEALDFE